MLFKFSIINDLIQSPLHILRGKPTLRIIILNLLGLAAASLTVRGKVLAAAGRIVEHGDDFVLLPGVDGRDGCTVIEQRLGACAVDVQRRGTGGGGTHLDADVASMGGQGEAGGSDGQLIAVHGALVVAVAGCFGRYGSILVRQVPANTLDTTAYTLGCILGGFCFVSDKYSSLDDLFVCHFYYEL